MKSNLLGPIADTYEELQSLPLLFEAAQSLPLPEGGSENDALRACWQSMEIAVINLEMLFNQLSRTPPKKLIEALEMIGPWIAGTADVMLQIVSTSITINSQKSGNILSLSDSPNVHNLIKTQNSTAEYLLENISALAVIGNGNIVHILRYSHFFREVIAHGNFYNSYENYSLFVAPEPIRKAVLELEFKGSTLISQFRAAHQIPELLVATINRHIESVLSNPEITPDVAYLTLLRVDFLLAPVLSSTNLLDSLMSANDYHKIRENLGKTSGSQSNGIQAVFLRQLWPSLYSFSEKKLSNPLLQMIIRSIGNKVDRWKITHTNLPRQKLGANSSGVKSLIGSKDAYGLVQKMRELAESEAPTHISIPTKNPPTALDKLEHDILGRIAAITQNRFPNVQNRTGFYSDK